MQIISLEHDEKKLSEKKYVTMNNCRNHVIRQHYELLRIFLLLFILKIVLEKISTELFI